MPKRYSEEIYGDDDDSVVNPEDNVVEESTTTQRFEVDDGTGSDDGVPSPEDNVVSDKPVVVSDDEDDDNYDDTNDDDSEVQVDDEDVSEQIVRPKKKKIKRISPRPMKERDVEAERYASQLPHYRNIPDEMLPDLLLLIREEIDRWHHEHIQDDENHKQKKMGFFESLFEDRNAKFKREYRLALETEEEYELEKRAKYERIATNMAFRNRKK